LKPDGLAIATITVSDYLPTLRPKRLGIHSGNKTAYPKRQNKFHCDLKNFNPEVFSNIRIGQMYLSLDLNLEMNKASMPSIVAGNIKLCKAFVAPCRFQGAGGFP
jgi:hypothetical protein